MNKLISSNGLVVGFLAVALACTAFGASSAEAANPVGGGVVSTGGPNGQPTNVNNANNANNNGNNANNQNAGGQGFVIRAGGNVPRPGAGVVTPHLNAGQLAALKPNIKPRGGVMPHLVPNQIFAIGMAEGVEVAPGIVAQVNADEPVGFSVGSDGTPSAQFNPHRAPGAAQDTVALMLLPENATQDYAVLFDVSPGLYNVSVDAFTVDALGHYTDIVLSTSSARTNALNQIVVNYDHTSTPTTGVYVILSSSSSWSFQRATGFRR